MPTPAKPLPPTPTEPKDWEHYDLWLRVREALLALPAYFRTATSIEGLQATDIFTLSEALGATIEDQVVQTLNAMRPVWDPEKQYQPYAFIRRAQTFPDVVLRKKTNGQQVLMGIEMKGWYLLAKEAAPNFRFAASKDACNPQDLIAVVPWALSNVLAGAPIVFPPFIQLARYAAEKRNYYWQFERKAKSDSGITLATGATPYPDKSDKIQDSALVDSGNNFGRLARYGIMDAYIAEMMQTKVRGIHAKDWIEFFSKHVSES